MARLTYAVPSGNNTFAAFMNSLGSDTACLQAHVRLERLILTGMAKCVSLQSQPQEAPQTDHEAQGRS